MQGHGTRRKRSCEGAMERLRPILMTSIVAIFGLLPASLATGLGSDVQRPLATVIVWGLFSSTTLTLFVVPVFYRLLVAGPAQAGRLGRRFRGRGPLARRALARRLHGRHRGPAGTPQRPRRTAGRVPYLRRDEPRVRPRDRRRQGRRNARLHRNAGAHGRPYCQGQGLCRRAAWNDARPCGASNSSPCGSSTTCRS